MITFMLGTASAQQAVKGNIAGIDEPSGDIYIEHATAKIEWSGPHGSPQGQGSPTLQCSASWRQSVVTKREKE